MRFAYHLFIYIYLFIINIASAFNKKARKWISGRKSIFEKIKNSIKPNEKTIWFHCASLGEFEQGRPLIEKIKSQNPTFKILITFFSPSGYEVRKNYEGADYIFYLPMDTPENAKKFISIINPHAAFFIKYEFWFNYLQELKNKNIPTFLISGILRENHYFFNWYGDYFKQQLTCFTHLFMQDETSKKLLLKNGFNNVSVTGDTRFDRVNALYENTETNSLVALFKGNSNLLIAGSTWPKDEILLSAFVNKNAAQYNFKIIIAPHEVSDENILHIEEIFKELKTTRYSRANEKNIKDSQLLIIDSVGILSSLYQYGTIAYIGGGFGKGIHNILEAAVFGLPVIFGPNYKKFKEAIELIEKGAANCIENETELQVKIVFYFSNNENLQQASQRAKQYVSTNKGATDTIYNHIKKEINL